MAFFVLGMHAGYAIYFPELFPTRLRATGASVCFNLGRVLGAVILVIRGELGSASRHAPGRRRHLGPLLGRPGDPLLRPRDPRARAAGVRSRGAWMRRAPSKTERNGCACERFVISRFVRPVRRAIRLKPHTEKPRERGSISCASSVFSRPGLKAGPRPLRGRPHQWGQTHSVPVVTRKSLP